MGRKIKLPVGLRILRKYDRKNFTILIRQNCWSSFLKSGKVNLFTRPRRFGKTLNMSMLRYFFEIGTDESLFDGLYIKNNKKICEEYMGKFPVIFISLKNVEGLDFETALYRFVEIIGREAERFYFLLHSEKLTVNEKERYKTLIRLDNGRYSMDVNILASALRLLSELLYKHYGKKTIIIIDEYDVPLDKAFRMATTEKWYHLYEQCLGTHLKPMIFLQFAGFDRVTRVSKESIFTGLNNFKVLSIADTRFDEQFGFTDEEVQTLLESYGLLEHISETKEWYDGYHFGDADVYCRGIL